jgi:alpha-D-ribose 1-methylphosphonate 5-triphosphate diphosphatase PhnM
MRILLIDDLRTRYDKNVVPHVSDNDDLTIARTFADGIKAMRDHRWDLLLLDHDLADRGPVDNDIYVLYYSTQIEWTGYEVLCFLEKNLDDHPEYVPDDIKVVSDNARRRTMELTINNIYPRLIAMEKQVKNR